MPLSSEIREQALEATHHAAEGVAVASMVATIGGFTLASGDVVCHAVYDIFSKHHTVIDKIGEIATATGVLGLVALVASSITLRFTDRLRGESE